MQTGLKERIAQMQQKLSSRHPVAEIHADSQLFVSPEPVCDRLVALADIRPGDRVLEPNAGTGAILRAILAAQPAARCECVEVNYALVRHLQSAFPGVPVNCSDFLSYQPAEPFDRIIMNPPFRHAADLKHIRHALTMLAPDGCLVAVCTTGPRQQRALREIAVHHEELPRGTFSYTDVSTMIVRINAPDTAIQLLNQ
ncbi:class I SAM-dependent methyltransferase [Pantoea coffeiphila]|uniref:SAM-dependent methyltransferase n=1 Tax=Pantoea coffeiphila TaxID=1465635 RepID=A0A2S9I6Z6_9GAMM|nr:class I SAM-dependent methyltransferase [Pantoea coffeiphila]PRD13562.1 SAM-dependent methyltransferase [Pantoea coffeiphila]